MMTNSDRFHSFVLTACGVERDDQQSTANTKGFRPQTASLDSRNSKFARSSVTLELHRRHLTCLLCFRLQSACFPIGCFIPCDNLQSACLAFLCVPAPHKSISDGKY